MASVCNRKRPNADDVSQDKPPAKRPKFAASRRRRKSNFPPSFWDNLSKVWLTPRALRELNRRNKVQAPRRKPTAPAGALDTHLASFARRGGPGLCHLRGYPEPRSAKHTMSSGSSSALPQSRRGRSSKATTKARRSSAYDNDFEQHLMDNSIYPEGYHGQQDDVTPKPCNLDSLHRDLLPARSSLSPSRFSESAFQDFRRKNKTKSEGTLMRNVMPIIAGNADIPNEGNLPFTNYASLTNGVTVKPVPDYFDGASSGDIDKEVGKSIGQMVIPTKHPHVPVAPNFFLEAKAPGGAADVAERQACYDGAHGARAMHALQTYGETEPVYDGNAYTYSSIYHSSGTLQLYAHHATPSTADGQPEYHMTVIDGWQMTGNINTFRRGAAAFRNARDIAQRHRNAFIQAANARAAQAAKRMQEDAVQGAMPTSQEVHGSAHRPDCNACQDADNAPQQHIPGGSDHALQNDADIGAAAIFYTEDASQNQSQGSVMLDYEFQASEGVT
ncbi:hypothetical protein OCS_04275 [Ophiocordyceps sinensis CO18]|uniref:DUF7924 domain-containing protein n=1 Tax=Ophiocordyceps sinensis (strain Co18 / CGMCC 3.14243) TaxID=911162 RepID=T5ADU7_OPHSC|nr:hypothetical protein OCS_04275 [Ophiocordyceps sinensis CO18]